MEEIESSSLFFALDILNCQLVILLHDLRKIFLPDRVRLILRSDYRLDGHLVKSKICEMLHILREIQIVAGKGTADIVILACAALRELLELRNGDLITAAVTVSGRTHVVIDFLTSVQAHDYIAHLTVTEVHDLIV